MHMLTRPDCDCAFNFSKSQYAEDLIMLPTLLHARRGSPGHGVFVELGALDGIAFSNTYMLERCFGWRGLLIEGNPASFAKLRESGRASTFLHSAVCGASDPPFVEFTVDGGPVAGQVGQLTRGHQHKWGWWNRKKGVANVSCAPLSTLLHQSEHFGMAAESDAAEVDLLSLDVEGAEALVLSTISPLTRIKAVVVELDGTDRAKDEKARKLLRDAGMRRAETLKVANSEVFLREGVVEKPALISSFTDRKTRRGACSQDH